MNELRTGTKVTVCNDRLGIVEDTLRYVQSGEVTRYYVRFLNKKGEPSKRASWCHPNNLKPV